MQKECKKCRREFEITSSDEKFYSKVNVPHPKFCPVCRAQRRLAWRNERNLYINKSALSGQKIISTISPDKPQKIYKGEEWWSDQYDPLDYGKNFDFKRPFFQQFSELLQEVPHINMVGNNNENCDYGHLLANCKNCYLIIESSNNEDCYYGYWLQKCLGCCDVSYSHECQYSYELENCYNSYNIKWSSDCAGCSDGYFLKNCIGVKNSFCCVNLHHKEYCVFNEQKTKEEYFAFIEKINFESYKEIEQLKEEFNRFVLKFPHKYAQIIQSENCSGDYMVRSRNCENCYHAHDAEFCKYGEHVWRNSKYNMDVSTAGRDTELIYEGINTAISSYNLQFAVQNWTCSDMQYCYSSFNSSNNFGCVGLKRNKYCILNKQYTKEDYLEMKEKIIEHMKKTEEWGEFFPANISPFGYNETVAQEQYPLTKEQAKKEGFAWSEYQSPSPEATKIIEANKLPYSNKDIPEVILDWAIKCETSGKLFKIIKEELRFYRKHKIPIPRKHPDVRHQERINKRNPNTLWDRSCDNCSKSIKTTYAPVRPEKVYCENCYLDAIG
jgi:hypothetical protein